MRRTVLIVFAGLLGCCLSSWCVAQTTNSNGAVPAPGSSLPGLGALAMGMQGPGYIEMGGGYSDLTGNYANWNDFYIRGMVSGGRNVFTGEITREDHFNDTGWFGDLAWTRTLSENWFAQASAGGSVGGFFLNRYSVDGLLNRKFLRRRQLVLTAGGGYDQSKTIANDWRIQAEGSYYFQYPVVLQGGFAWTHSNPGDILARIQYIAATQGYDKEHYISLRYEWGREGYEVLSSPVGPVQVPNVLFDFPEHTITGTWRQWVGPRWGLNFNLEQHQETSYHRIGGTVGVFLDF